MCRDSTLAYYITISCWPTLFLIAPASQTFHCVMSFVLHLHNLMVHTCVFLRTKAWSALKYIPLIPFHSPLVQALKLVGFFPLLRFRVLIPLPRREHYSAPSPAHGLEIGLSISFCLFPFTFGTKIFAQMIPYPYLWLASVLFYVRINRSTKSFKIMANEACRNMQVASVGVDYIYYIF